jgi:hypothetical protein
MASLKEDIPVYANRIAAALISDGYKIDFSIHSLLQLDQFFELHSKDGKALEGGRLSFDIGPTLFSLGCYIGEVLITHIPGAEWVTDDNDPQGDFNAMVKFPDGSVCWPMQRAIKRFKNGLSDAIYPYAYEVAEIYIKEPFDQRFWELKNE